MRKATHYGICQVCGHRQKLPAGRLAKHGYTTRAGFFQGTCWGAGHLPFEQDISLIEGAIAAAAIQAAANRERAAGLRMNANPADVIYHAYESDWQRHGGSRFWKGYRHLHGRLEKRGYQVWFVADEIKYETNTTRVNDLPAVATEFNGYYAVHLDRSAEQAEAYVGWQQERIKGWKPSELTPVE